VRSPDPGFPPHRYLVVPISLAALQLLCWDCAGIDKSRPCLAIRQAYRCRPADRAAWEPWWGYLLAVGSSRGCHIVGCSLQSRAVLSRYPLTMKFRSSKTSSIIRNLNFTNTIYGTLSIAVDSLISSYTKHSND